MLNVMSVANHIINYSNQKEYDISNLRLQKLLYFVQAYYLALTEQEIPCFADEIVAWDFGPVVPCVYEQYKKFGCGSITKVLSFNDNDIDNSVIPKNIPKKDQEKINAVVDKFSDFSNDALVSLVRNQQPWKQAHLDLNGEIISKDVLKKYFQT